MKCFETLTRRNALTPCPNYREGRVIVNFTEIRGMDFVLNAIRQNKNPAVRAVDGEGERASDYYPTIH